MGTVFSTRSRLQPGPSRATGPTDSSHRTLTHHGPGPSPPGAVWKSPGPAFAPHRHTSRGRLRGTSEEARSERVEGVQLAYLAGREVGRGAGDAVGVAGHRECRRDVVGGARGRPRAPESVVMGEGGAGGRAPFRRLGAAVQHVASPLPRSRPLRPSECRTPPPPRAGGEAPAMGLVRQLSTYLLKEGGWRGGAASTAAGKD